MKKQRNNQSIFIENIEIIDTASKVNPLQNTMEELYLLKMVFQEIFVILLFLTRKKILGSSNRKNTHTLKKELLLNASILDLWRM